MSEYITKETAIRILHEASYLSDGSLIEVSGYIAEGMIKDEPPADVAHVRRGKWVDSGSLSCRCDQCGCKNTKETPFCPFCGAKMDCKRREERLASS